MDGAGGWLAGLVRRSALLLVSAGLACSAAVAQQAPTKSVAEILDLFSANGAECRAARALADMRAPEPDADSARVEAVYRQSATRVCTCMPREIAAALAGRAPQARIGLDEFTPLRTRAEGTCAAQQLRAQLAQQCDGGADPMVGVEVAADGASQRRHCACLLAGVAATSDVQLATAADHALIWYGEKHREALRATAPPPLLQGLEQRCHAQDSAAR
jgi:hypothetical protein